MAADHDEFVLALTPREAEFVHRVGRHLRKQEGWWDAREWEDTLWSVQEKFEGLPWNASALFGSSAESTPEVPESQTRIETDDDL